jgi:hypothetical protein
MHCSHGLRCCSCLSCVAHYYAHHIYDCTLQTTTNTNTHNKQRKYYYRRIAPPKGKRSHIKLGRYFRDISIREVIIDDDGATVIEPLQTTSRVTPPHTELLQRMSAITAQVAHLSEQLRKQQEQQQQQSQQQQQQQRRNSSTSSSAALQHTSSFVVPATDAAATAETKTSGGAAIGLLRSAYAHTAEQPVPIKRLSSQLKTANSGSTSTTSSSSSGSSAVLSSSTGFLRRRNRNGSTTASTTAAADANTGRLSASTGSSIPQRIATSTSNTTTNSSTSGSSRSLSGLGSSGSSRSGSMRLKAEDVNEWRQRATALLKKQESRRAAVRLQAAIRGHQQVRVRICVYTLHTYVCTYVLIVIQ